MKNKLKKIIKEVVGQQIDIAKISKNITDEVYKTAKEKENTDNPTKVEINDINILDFKSIFISFEFDGDSEIKRLKVGGAFKPHKIVKIKDNFYDIFIDLTIFNYKKTKEEQETLYNEINSAMNHELLHAFEYIKKLQSRKISTSHEYNKILKNSYIEALVEGNSLFFEFRKMFYLSLPHEINARVQETASHIKQIKEISKMSYNEIMEFLLKNHIPLQEAKALNTYRVDDLLKLKKPNLNLFIKYFNEAVKDISDKNNLNFKLYNEPKEFFEYWKERFNDAGRNLTYKIGKLATNHDVLTEILAETLKQEEVFDYFVSKKLFYDIFYDNNANLMEDIYNRAIFRSFKENNGEIGYIY